MRRFGHDIPVGFAADLAGDVREELYRATQAFGPMASAHEGWAVIQEEVDELWDEIKGGQDKTRMREEAIQVAAMAMRFVIDVAPPPVSIHDDPCSGVSGREAGADKEPGLDSFYRNGIYEALRQSSPEVENGKLIALTGQDLLDMAGAVFDYLNSLPVQVVEAVPDTEREK